MQFEIPEATHVQIIVGNPAPTTPRSTLPELPDETASIRPAAPRSGRPLLKGGLLVMLLAASFAAGDYFASRPRAPELTRAAAALPRPAPAGEQHPFPDRPLPREAAVPPPTERVPAEFQKQLQQPPMVIPPPGPAATPLDPSSNTTPGKNLFGLEN